MDCWVGFDIGGTKCAVCTGVEEAGAPCVLKRHEIATPATQAEAMERMCAMALDMTEGCRVLGAGVSTGGPLDRARGVLLNPPNLPGWSGASWTERITRALGAPAFMENDANACALAEWRWGAGQGCRSMAFLTFGTGLGAGLILDGRLYRGACGMAGELGHWRLSDYGPTGYGKEGSFEGFCSGGGIRQLAETLALRERQKGAPVSMGPGPLTARVVAEAAGRGDPLALEALDHVARQLGRGLALLVGLFDKMVEKLTLAQEALPASLAACRILPAALATASATTPRWPLPWPEPSRPRCRKTKEESDHGSYPLRRPRSRAGRSCGSLPHSGPAKGGHSRAL